MNATPTEPSALRVQLRDGVYGYVAVVGWQILTVADLDLDRTRCVRFTHENLSSLRKDDFHVNLLATVRRTMGCAALSWVPFPP